MIVLFNELPGDARERLARVGITVATLFERAGAAAAIGPASAYRAIANWTDVERVYPDRPLELLNYQATKDTGVDHVRDGDKPLRRGYTGDSVTVAVVDTGIATTHPDLDDRVTTSLSFTASQLSDPATGGPLVGEPVVEPVGVDDWGHGTHVGGIVAGTGEAALGPDDMRGVAPDASLISLKIGSAVASTAMTESSALAAYEWILAHHDDPDIPGGIRVINNSWGTFEELPALRRLIQQAIDTGIVVVAASGNEGADGMRWPALYPEVIAVGAVCKDADDWSHRAPLEWMGAPPVGPTAQLCGPDRVWSGSGQGEALDVVAPAVDVWSAYSPGALMTPTGFFPVYRPPAPGAGNPVNENNNRLWYTWSIGTSMAAPHVSGVIALMLEADPCLTPARVNEILRETATNLGPPGFDVRSGYGRVDAFKAVRASQRGARSCNGR